VKWDAEKYDAVRAPQVDAGKELIAMARIGETDSVLDIGCGTGKLTMELARRASKGEVVGIDPSEEMLQKARRVSAGAKNISLMGVAAESIDFIAKFDLVFSNSALQWVKNQHQAIASVHRALKQGGRIAFQLPAKNFCREFFDYTGKAILSLGFERFFENFELPWYLPSREEYMELLNDEEFYNIKVFYKDYKVVFVSINEILDWWSSAGLRPYLVALPEREQEYFIYAVGMQYENNRTKRGIEFDFRRLFAFAEK
jgi:trans-aconitate 2-methyltransferase